MKILGIDLAGKPENPTGISILNVSNDLKILDIKFDVFYEDEEILKKTDLISPSLITIDAPLSLPKGGCCLSKDCSCSKVGGHFREAERKIRKYGSVLPLTFRGMRMLTERGIGLSNRLKGKYKVIEVHPRTVQKVLGFDDLYRDLSKYFKLPDGVTEHELDAALTAITGLFYIKNCYMEFGDPEEGTIILPKNVNCLKKVFEE
ncbi:DUF429 domain-containing protein [Methanobacterium paludis]|uniref:DUF429 domain-containing protein n=1 Tax=Methanobacterium paludis (strain DSM 25820 / JCM 18151 / SWAN1) TaxID=868131 RepID=F6D2X0_METPW|nr:DUF429 domain-containing protein [Methanobacterium paludis]AEG19099.1 hypothetical protein MSWAN_2091 [Methanobacterium paludis]